MDNILITGSAGFIGSALYRNLEDKYNVYGVDNFSDYYDINLKKNRIKQFKNSKNFLKLDILDSISLNEFIKSKKINVIIHLAAQAGVRHSLKDPKSYITNNIVGTFNILEACKKIKIKHLLMASTSSVYGFEGSENFVETLPCNEPVSLYSASKKSTENIAHSYAYNFKIPITVFRFFTVYGPWGRPDMALFKFTDSILNNKPIKLYNNGEMWRDFTYIDDLTDGIRLLINTFPSSKRYHNDSLSKNAPYRIVNIGNQKSIKLIDFVETLERVIKKKAIKINKPMQKGDVPYTQSNSNLLKNLTNYIPSTDLEDGIKSFYKWYLNYYNKILK